ncbi:NADP-dependent oxidoreductase domain-containing protein [Aspergillus cavernicola]|uniref:NADP-dependent oxidoreductase domain-containing protein n=1 Tax=Aspergillus cavernicola TaxID=176166 RepID=A0ABR4HZP2_9EURO
MYEGGNNDVGVETLWTLERDLDPMSLCVDTDNLRQLPLCLGTMTFGDQQQDRYGECSKEEASSILDHFYSEGGNFLDTSNVYQNGQAEQWVGEWMAARRNRDDMVLATKYSNSARSGDNGIIKSNYGGNGTKSMKLSLEISLKRLQTSYVDIFYVHYWDFTTSVEELMQSLNDLVSAGKVLYLGISDAPAWVVSKANQYARMANLRPFVRDIIPMSLSEGMGLAAYGVLNQGRFQTEEAFKEREKANPGRKFIAFSEHDKKISKALDVLSSKKGVKLLDIALAYVRSKAPYVFPLVGARKLDHIQGSIAALEVSLTEDEVKEIDSAYPFDHGFPHSFLSGTLFSGGKEPSRGASGPEDVWLTKAHGTFDWVSQAKPIGHT